MLGKIDSAVIEELQELYEELHLISARAATLLRLGSPAGSLGDTQQEFLRLETRVAEIWRRINELRDGAVPRL